MLIRINLCLGLTESLLWQALAMYPMEEVGLVRGIIRVDGHLVRLDLILTPTQTNLIMSRGLTLPKGEISNVRGAIKWVIPLRLAGRHTVNHAARLVILTVAHLHKIEEGIIVQFVVSGATIDTNVKRVIYVVVWVTGPWSVRQRRISSNRIWKSGREVEIANHSKVT